MKFDVDVEQSQKKRVRKGAQNPKRFSFKISNVGLKILLIR